MFSSKATKNFGKTFQNYGQRKFSSQSQGKFGSALKWGVLAVPVLGAPFLFQKEALAYTTQPVTQEEQTREQLPKAKQPGSGGPVLLGPGREANVTDRNPSYTNPTDKNTWLSNKLGGGTHHESAMNNPARITKEELKEKYYEGKSGMKEGYDKMKEKGSEAYETVRDKAYDAKSGVREGYEKAKEKGSEAYDAAKDKASEGYNKAKQAYYETKDEARAGYEKAAEETSSMYDDLKRKAQHGYEATVDTVKGTAHKIWEGVEEGVEKVKNVMPSISPSSSEVPGDSERMKTRVGEAIATTIQSKSPLGAFHTHWTNIELYPDNPRRQLETHHFVAHLNEDFMQSLIYDSDKSDAKLLGVEYIITERLFQQLPYEERKMWHSNVYPVKSGVMVAPRLPWSVEHKLMEDLIPTYSKSFVMWHGNDPLPYGAPQLLVTPTRDGFINERLLKERDQKYGINTYEERRNRSDIPIPRTLEGADAWERGDAVQLRPVRVTSG